MVFLMAILRLAWGCGSEFWDISMSSARPSFFFFCRETTPKLNPALKTSVATNSTQITQKTQQQPHVEGSEVYFL